MSGSEEDWAGGCSVSETSEEDWGGMEVDVAADPESPAGRPPDDMAVVAVGEGAGPDLRDPGDRMAHARRAKRARLEHEDPPLWSSRRLLALRWL